ncbi:MAG: hypothetical protein NTZ03_13070 [Actinobacteria bacterium]|nr:hypothetical protein [Actinomycetota bacterium]
MRTAEPARGIHLAPLMATLAVCVAAVLITLHLTSQPLLPGLDGAYYWVQVRAIIEEGRFAFNDVPLVFLAQAALAEALRLASGADVTTVVPMAVRMSMVLFMAASVVPIAWFARRHRDRPWLLPILSALVLLNPVQLFFLTGDFIKNAAAVPLLLAMGFLIIEWWTVPARARRIACVVLMLGLALTHFGTFLLALCIVVLWLVARAIAAPGKSWVVLSPLALAGVFIALLAWFSPDRLARVSDLLLSPGTLIESPMWIILRFSPGVVPWPIVFAMVAGQVGSLVLAVVCVRRRGSLPPEIIPVLVSLLVTTFVLSSPLIGYEWSARLAALSFLSLVLALAALWVASPVTTWPLAAMVVTAAVVMMSLLGLRLGATPPALTASEWEEFQTLTSDVALAPNSIVVAPHGLEFLAAWSWRTNVIQDRYAGAMSDVDGRSVYLLLHIPAEGAFGWAPSQSGGKPDVEGTSKEGGVSSSAEAGSLAKDQGGAAMGVAVLYKSAGFVLLKANPS